MKEEQLNEAAWDFAQDRHDGWKECQECDECFKAGARWHESLPLAERLSESEKEWIRAIYCIPSMSDINAKYVEQALLEAIFGKNLFTPTE